MVSERKLLGQRGEDAACEYLERRGLKILERNWKCGYGEADIIALDGNVLVFCEVKTRKSLAAGAPEESVTYKKQQRYYKLAQVYRSRATVSHCSVRFDVVSILVGADGTSARLNYLPTAFGLD